MTAIEAFDARDFGLAVKRLRNARGWTQADLAEWLGVNRVTVVRMEQGRPVALMAAMREAVSAADAAHPGLRADVRAASLEQLERVSRS